MAWVPDSEKTLLEWFEGEMKKHYPPEDVGRYDIVRIRPLEPVQVETNPEGSKDAWRVTVICKHQLMGQVWENHFYFYEGEDDLARLRILLPKNGITPLVFHLRVFNMFEGTHNAVH